MIHVVLSHGVVLRRCAVLLLAGCLAFAVPQASAQPNPEGVYAQSVVSQGGTGCPGGSVQQAINSLRTMFTLGYDQFIASTGPGIPVTQSRKNCQTNFNLNVPVSPVWAVGTLTVRGFVQLPEGVHGEIETVLSLGDNEPVTVTTPIVGPFTGNYVHTVTTPPIEVCSGGTMPSVKQLNANSQVRIVGPTSRTAQMTQDFVNGQVQPRDVPAPGDTVWHACE